MERRSGASVSITLFVPGLLGPWPRALHDDITGGLEVAGLIELLNRTQAPLPPNDQPPCSVEALLLDALYPGGGWPSRVEQTGPAGPGEAWPYAAITYAFDTGETATDWVMRCDPVHLRPDVGTAYLFAGDELELEQAEAEALAGTLNAHFAEEGFRLEVPTPARWYLRQERPPQLVASPPSVIARQEVGAFLPAEEGALTWRRRFNEAQMVLYQAETNLARESRGALPVNSVWFWGAGKLPADTPRDTSSYTCVWSDLALVGGLGVLGWETSRLLPANVDEWFVELEPGRHLVVLDAAYGAVISNDVEAWRRALEDFEVRWTPLLRAWERSIGLELRVDLVPGQRELPVRRPRFFDRWQRKREFAQLLGESDAC